MVIFVLALADRQAIVRRSAADPAGNDDAATASTAGAARHELHRIHQLSDCQNLVA
ncbi:hypothetical protein LJR234_002286 [Mesorhizobium amorphae]|uniref:hypothetical protein n=1 Tax=Mesorhizobium amorphae TaxID=71433 RepID=UPI003ECF502A